MSTPHLLNILLVQIEDYERSAEDDEHFGIDHLKAMDAAEASQAVKSLETIPEKEIMGAVHSGRTHSVEDSA